MALNEQARLLPLAPAIFPLTLVIPSKRKFQILPGPDYHDFKRRDMTERSHNRAVNTSDDPRATSFIVTVKKADSSRSPKADSDHKLSREESPTYTKHAAEFQTSGHSFSTYHLPPLLTHETHWIYTPFCYSEDDGYPEGGYKYCAPFEGDVTAPGICRHCGKDVLKEYGGWEKYEEVMRLTWADDFSWAKVLPIPVEVRDECRARRLRIQGVLSTVIRTAETKKPRS